MQNNFKQLKTSYKIPDMLQKDINALEQGVKDNVNYIDCLQDEVRGSAHGVTDDVTFTEDMADEIIDYYCRRRW